MKPRLIVLSDRHSYPGGAEALCSLCEETKEAELAIVIRDRDASLHYRMELAARVGPTARANGQMLIMSDRLDMAKVVGADGLHLPADGLSPLTVSGRMAWLSRAGHGVDALSREELSCLSAVLISPVWAARKGREAIGLDEFDRRARRLRERSPTLCVYALGGVDAQEAAQSMAGGADGVAAIGAALDPTRRERLLRALELKR